MSSIAIEQDADSVKLAIAVHQNAALSKVRLVKARLNSKLGPDAGSGEIDVSFHFKTKLVELGAEALRFEIQFRMAGLRGIVPEEIVGVDCTFEAVYDLRPDFVVTKEMVEAFQKGNAIFNVWPYFREYLQSSLTRMGYPPLVAPFLVLKPKRAKHKVQVDQVPAKRLTGTSKAKA